MTSYSPNNRAHVRLVEQHRDINVGHDWWSGVYDDWIAKLARQGVMVGSDDIRFSGFWSQGDGASFTGEVRVQDMLTFVDHHKLGEEFPSLRWVVDHGADVRVRIARRHSRYAHAHTVTATLDWDEFVLIESEDEPVKKAVHRAHCARLNEQYGMADDKINDLLRAQMGELYRDLEQLYEHLTSDEQVWATLVANDMVEDEMEIAA